MNNKAFPREMSFEEMEKIVDDARFLDFLDAQDEQKAWGERQRARAAVVLGLLRRHLPAEALREVEDFLSSAYGCNRLHYELTGQELDFF